MRTRSVIQLSSAKPRCRMRLHATYLHLETYFITLRKLTVANWGGDQNGKITVIYNYLS
jgi:hypothetical protein